MLVISDSQERVIKRSRALGYKEVVIADDVERGDEVSFDFGTDGRIHVVKNSEQLAEDEEPYYTIITKEIGLFGEAKGLKSVVDIILCDDCMIVTLLRGCIVIRPEEDTLTIPRGIAMDDIPDCYEDEIKWISVEDVTSYVKDLADSVDDGILSGKYPLDYEYIVEVSGEKIGILSNLTFRKFSDLKDISDGMIASKIAVMKAKEAKKMYNTIASAQEDDDNDDWDVAESVEEDDDSEYEADDWD